MSYADFVLSHNPSAYYRLEESSGTSIADSSGNSHTLTKSGTVTFEQEGAVDNAFLFNDGRIYDMTYAVQPSGDRTYMFWVKLRSSDTSANGYIISYGNAFDVVFHFGGANTIGIFRNTASPSIASSDLQIVVPRDDKWHHVVIVYDAASGLTGYLDGNSVDTHAVTGSATVSDKFTIGRSGSNSTPFIGFLDEIAIFESALDSDDVTELFETRFVRDTAGAARLIRGGGGFNLGL